jgi:hypothetical protein
MLMSVEKLVARLVFGQLAGELAMFGVDKAGVFYSLMMVMMMI